MAVCLIELFTVHLVLHLSFLFALFEFNFSKVDSRIEEINKNRINLFFFINKGEKTKISKIYFIGNKKVRDRRLRDIIVSKSTNFGNLLLKLLI